MTMANNILTYLKRSATDSPEDENSSPGEATPPPVSDKRPKLMGEQDAAAEGEYSSYWESWQQVLTVPLF